LRKAAAQLGSMTMTALTSGLIRVVIFSQRGSQPREKCDSGRIFPS
jgi:hypothetical protein